MGIITKGGRITGSSKSLGRKMSGSSLSTPTGQNVTVKPTYTAPSATSSYVAPTSSRSMLSGVNYSALSEEQKKKLRDKGYNIPTTTKPTLSAQGKANVQALVQKNLAKQAQTNNAQTAFNSLFQGSTANLLGKTPGVKTPGVQFSVIPGATKTVDLGYAGSFPTSTQTSTRPEESQKYQEILNERARISQEVFTPERTQMMMGATAGSAGAIAGLRAGAASKVTGAAKNIWDRVSKVFGQKQTASAIKALKGTASGADDAARSSLLRQSAQAAFRAAPVTTTISSLGAAVVGYDIGESFGADTPAGTPSNVAPAGTVRNALVAPTSGQTSVAQAGTTSNVLSPKPSEQTADTTQAVTDTTQTSTSPSPATTAPTTVSGRPQHLSASSTGPRASGGTVTEPITDNQEIAQERAMELQLSKSQQTAVSASPIGDTVDMGGLVALRDRARELLNQYGSDAVTMPEFNTAIQQMLASNLANLNAIQPTPPQPVVDTPEQVDWLNQMDPLQIPDIKQFMDQTRISLGMPEMEAKKLGFMKDLEAIQETYRYVIDDIRKNPNLPKGLAARRLSEVFEKQKFAASSVLANLEQIDAELENANTQLNQQLGIFEYNVGQQEKAYQRRVDMFGYLVDSGAIGGLNSTEMQQWAAETGIPLQAIEQLKNNANSVETDYGTRFETDAYGNVHMITYDKNNPLGGVTVDNLGTFGKGSGTGTSGNTLTLSEVVKFGLPYSFNGATEEQGAQFLNEISSEQVPDWFSSALIDSGEYTAYQWSFMPDLMQERWDEYRSQYGPESDTIAGQLAGIY